MSKGRLKLDEIISTEAMNIFFTIRQMSELSVLVTVSKNGVFYFHKKNFNFILHIVLYIPETTYFLTASVPFFSCKTVSLSLLLFSEICLLSLILCSPLLD